MKMVDCYNGLQDFEILRDFCISIYYASALSLRIESTDSMIVPLGVLFVMKTLEDER